ncbi:MAG: ergothioneine biosynthesis protein EgtB, partial [Actinomycetes bacterium]
PFHPAFDYLYNSYYESVGERFPRHRRGMVTRPGVTEISAYRTHVNDAMATLFDTGAHEDTRQLIELGIHHEQQHQELLLMDIHHVLAQSPVQHAYAEPIPHSPEPQAAGTWHELDGGIVDIGHDTSAFAFDNEGPAHPVLLAPFRIADQLVTSGQWMAFVDDGGYERPELWLADGWATVQAERWTAPLYWERRDDTWQEFTLHGPQSVDPNAPVAHISHYEADAFARWSKARLPTEFEWEHAVASIAGHAVGPSTAATFRPTSTAPSEPLADRHQQVWQWTSSAYLPYPGFRPTAGAVGEYNGKFMSGQMVLRGSSCLTPEGHARSTYRNFFPPAARWVCAGLRLADDQ